METEIDNATENAIAWMKSIREMVATLEATSYDENFTDNNADAYDAAKNAISESPLSIQVRSTAWHDVGDNNQEPDEFEILLSTGGPACRIHGDLGHDNQPENIHLEKQDWFQPWIAIILTNEDRVALEKFVNEFYFG